MCVCACFPCNENIDQDQDEDFLESQAEALNTLKSVFGSIPNSLDEMINHEKVGKYIRQGTWEVAHEVI